jgi:beta-glucanase (GH16 family)
VIRQSGGDCSIDRPAGFHTYALDWTPGTMTMTYDGTACWTTPWDPAAPLASPAPFDKPFFLCLTEAMGTGINALDPTAQLPATMDVDWVRVWK